ncbi:MAG TPA: hypothetical protein IGS40_23055 [Trichormus sp. M33_DOE_039]|nr:hypothetical protein [Trichormus sp. M33_DOE_039]
MNASRCKWGNNCIAIAHPGNVRQDRTAIANISPTYPKMEYVNSYWVQLWNCISFVMA